MPGASALCLYCTTLFMQRNGTNEPRGLMGVGGVEFPFTNHVSPRHGWSREVCEPMPRPPTHPPIPLTHPPTHPCTPPTSHCPSYPLVPITPVLFLLLSTHPSTHPLTQPLTHPPNHSCTLTKPPILNISISCQMSSHIIAQHPFRIQN